jgi:hypothetical protein
MRDVCQPLPYCEWSRTQHLTVPMKRLACRSCLCSSWHRITAFGVAWRRGGIAMKSKHEVAHLTENTTCIRMRLTISFTGEWLKLAVLDLYKSVTIVGYSVSITNISAFYTRSNRLISQSLTHFYTVTQSLNSAFDNHQNAHRCRSRISQNWQGHN